jgi:hypothetical protein
MDVNEKVLYQQVHPAKLAADVSGSLVSTYLMWRRRFVWAMLRYAALVVGASDHRRHKEFAPMSRPLW